MFDLKAIKRSLLKGMIVFGFLLYTIGTISAQNITITGKVTDSNGEPLAGAYVLVDGTRVGTSVNADGSYSISAPSTAVLRFSFVNFVEEAVPVGGRTTINVTMREDVARFEDVIVVAYGTARRGGFTGAAAQVDAKDIEVRPITTVTNALEGLSGVQITPGSGQPGSGPDIRIRGFGSMSGSNSPLIVVDGFPYRGSIADLNQNDIESMTVLKDASSAALYGSRAANGVVLISTKRGKAGTLNVNFRMTQGISQRSNPEYDRIGTYEYMPLMWESMRNGLVSGSGLTLAAANQRATNDLMGSTGVGYNAFGVPNDQVVFTDGTMNPAARLFAPDDYNWLDLVTRVGYRSDYNISANGGTENANFLISLGVLDDNSYIIKSDMTRYTMRASANVKPKKWFDIGMNLSVTKMEGSQTSTGTTYLNPFDWIRNMAPIYPVHKHTANGDYVLDGEGNKIYEWEGRTYSLGRHIVAETLWNDRMNTRESIAGKAFINIMLMEGLKFTINAGYDKSNRYNFVYENPSVGDGSPAGRSNRTYSASEDWNFNQLLNYTKTIGKHSFDILVGHESNETISPSFYAQKTGVIKEGNNELINFTDIANLYSYTDTRNIEGYLARANYSYADKYYFDASFRRDGTSRFYKDVRWGNFFSLGASWRLDKEDFMRGISWVDELKLRAAYGQTGNESVSNVYAWQSLYDIQRNANTPGFIQSRTVANRNLQWEKNSNIDIAVEYALFNRRLRGSIEFYHRVSSNLLFNVPMPVSSGVSSQPQNIGSMYNRGLEIGIAGDVIRKRDFTWNINMNANTLKNKITEMPPDQPEISSGNFRRAVGKSIYDYYLREWIGVNPADGLAMYLFDETSTSTNHFTYEGREVTTDQNVAKYDYVNKTAIPDLFGSITNSFRYKNLNLSFMISYRFGGTMYNSVYGGLMSVAGYGNSKHVDILNRWQNPGDITDVPIMDATKSASLGATSTRWFMSGTSASLRTATLSYNLPKNFVTNVLDLRSVSVYLSGENLYVLSAIKGMNPGQSFSGGTSTSYDPARIFTIGLNVAF